jgi:hypothetical protein
MSDMLVLKVGTVVRKVKDGIYCSDIETNTHPYNGVSNEMHVPRDSFEAFVDFIDIDSKKYVGLYDYLFFNYDNPIGRIRLINDVDFDNELCAVITKDDAKYFMDIYDQYREEIQNTPDDANIVLLPKLQHRSDMLKILVWLCLWIEYATKNCINPGLMSYLYCEED